MKRLTIGIIGAAVALLVAGVVGSYNRLIAMDQAVTAQWAQVENVYQRRADLVPNLVATVKGAAAFEKETFSAVAEARARVGKVSVDVSGRATDPDALRRFQEAQQGLGSALGRLLAVAERYPDLKATEAFRDLQAQLEGTENRIAVERMRFNEAAQSFNAKRQMFPTLLVAAAFGDRFRTKAYFTAETGASQPPRVMF